MINIRKSKVATLMASVVLTLSFSAIAEDNFKQAYNTMKPAKFAEYVKTLSSDKFGGRAPSSPGEAYTVEYMTKNFAALGLAPGNGKLYTQEVPLVSITSTPTVDLSIGEYKFNYRSDYVVNSSKLSENISVKNSQVVFVGYGIVAPEYDWNDYADIDVKGKTVVILVNDPGYATGDENLFTGKAMTYYGRWTYKYEEAARQGAAGAIIVHETKPASYGWNVVESSWTGAHFHLPTAENSPPLVDAEMWLSEEKTRMILKQANQDFDQLKEAAKQRGFKAVPLNMQANVAIANQVKRSISNNILATIKGSERPDEHIIYMAHWDHIGTKPNKQGDKIYNGALDNATGTAGLLLLAEAFQTLKTPPKRSVTFIAVTAEEQGLLGSKFYGENPVVPLNKTVGVINMDSLNIQGLKKDLTVVGFNKSQLQNYLAIAASTQKRKLLAESAPERGGFYRSDHFSLAKKGVPAIYAGGGVEPLNDKEAKINAVVRELRKRCYHQPCDEFNENWSLKSAIADLQVFFETGLLVANSNDWPNYYEGTEFKQARDESMKN
ncbi:MAG: M28 family metallopeptidase [Kangiellaceae bacterium]|jgi:Zn-dependent M28 family amino/carboxypeptidase|nr:M28 family metallopeptidase [Kangiellaceae bacterium]